MSTITHQPERCVTEKTKRACGGQSERSKGANRKPGQVVKCFMCRRDKSAYLFGSSVFMACKVFFQSCDFDNGLRCCYPTFGLSYSMWSSVKSGDEQTHSHNLWHSLLDLHFLVNWLTCLYNISFMKAWGTHTGHLKYPGLNQSCPGCNLSAAFSSCLLARGGVNGMWILWPDLQFKV